MQQPAHPLFCMAKMCEFSGGIIDHLGRELALDSRCCHIQGGCWGRFLLQQEVLGGRWYRRRDR